MAVLPLDQASTLPPLHRERHLPSASSVTERLRLHISPLNPTNLSNIIPPTVLSKATNISYHQLQTFPESNYGFVELPMEDAEKLRKKLNGSILKGSKMKVSKARPERERRANDAGAPEPDVAKPDKDHDRRAKRRRREEGHFPGLELPDGRQVQRGWTKPASSKSKGSKGSRDKNRKASTSSFTTKAECLFRTALPPKTASSSAPSMLADTQARVGERRVKDKHGRETVIHEFASTTKFSTFLRGHDAIKSGKIVSEFVDGKGWVDDGGIMLEAVPKSSRRTGAPPTISSQGKQAAEASQVGSNGPGTPTRPNVEESTSSSGSDESLGESSSSESGSESEVLETESSQMTSKAGDRKGKKAGPSAEPSPSRSREGSAPNLTITIPTSTDTAGSTTGAKPHPLESIFKRPARKEVTATGPETSQDNPTFSFFGPDNEEGEGGGGEAEPTMPQTPFTQRDFQERGIRSAAPTPDTAAPGRQFLFPWRDGDDDMDDDGEGERAPRKGAGKASPSHLAPPPLFDAAPGEGAGAGTEAEAGAQKGFEETFWERRGETNRAWKRRRREVGKERKKRDNKKLSYRSR
ncbi:MAG: hypothetical protein M1838_002747 [Thelocarpon superellum]|nr:MAG: hypothetical protein M1838_002747 [Thelocarpon superellum]